MSIVERDLKVYNLIIHMETAKNMFEDIKKLYGEEYTNSIPIDKNILKYFNNNKFKNETKNNEPRVYGKSNVYQGKKWLDEEYIIVENMINENKNISNISDYLGRSERSIESILLKLGLVKATLDDKNKVSYVKNPDKSYSWTLYHLKKLYVIYNGMEEICFENILKKLQPDNGICQGIWENGKQIVITEADIEIELKIMGLI